MRSSSTLLYISLFALLLLATKLAHALPGGGEAMPANKEPAVWIPNEAAIWKCSHKIKPGYSHYKLSGSDWNKTEKEIKRAVEDEGIITRWKFKNSTEFNEWKAPVSFESSVCPVRIFLEFAAGLNFFGGWLFVEDRLEAVLFLPFSFCKADLCHCAN
jgi:hypothetical protein